MKSIARELAIIGGGPAAMTLARRLHRLGHDVLVVTRERHPRTLEGFSERTLTLCAQFCGLEGRTSGFEYLTRDVCWNGVRSAANREVIVDRGLFDREIASAARQAGIEVMVAKAAAISSDDGGWRVSVKGGEADEVMVNARFLVEARGRAAPASDRKKVRGPRLVCIARRWRFPAEDLPRAAVGAFKHGWAWFIRGAAGRGVLQFFLDAASMRPRPELDDVYRRCMDAMPETREWLQGGRMEGDIMSRHAGMVLDENLCRTNYIRIGDAAMAIDPLSGHGVFKAIGGAMAAAPVINTLLGRPDEADVAMEFYRTRISDDFWTSARLARDFYREERRWPDEPFWVGRQGWPDDLPAHAPIKGGVAGVERRPVSVDDFIEERDVLVTPDQPRGVLHVGGIPAVAAWRMLERGRLAPAEVAAHFGVPHAVAAEAIRWFTERQLGSGQ